MKKAMKMFTGIAMAATMMFSGFAGFAGHDCHEDCCCDLCMTASAAPAHTCGQYVYDGECVIAQYSYIWRFGKNCLPEKQRIHTFDFIYECKRCCVCNKVISIGRLKETINLCPKN